VEPILGASSVRAVKGESHLPWFVSADQRALMQVLLNLLDNALKFSPEQSTIEIILSRREFRGIEYISTSIRDCGPGMEVREQERIFEPFYRIGSEMTRETAESGSG